MSSDDGAIPDWVRAHGGPVCEAVIRSSPEDFVVEEHLGVEADGDGEHDLLIVRKTGANTAWVGRQLAQHAGVPAGDVGYSGLKDRDAVTRQSFSVRRPNRDGTNWATLSVEGVEVLEVARHSRKIRRGTHKHNTFRIRLRGPDIPKYETQIRERLDLIASIGVPNYFGPQRFGRNGSNIPLARAIFSGKRMKRDKRSIGISAARSLLFNAILDARVRDGSWDTLLQGDIANLAGTGSVFPVDEMSDDLIRRCRDKDLHPTGSLWGDGAPNGSGAVADIEQKAVMQYEDLTNGLSNVRMDASQRPLRLLAHRLNCEFEADSVLLEFELGKGSFATAVLREIIREPRAISA